MAKVELPISVIVHTKNSASTLSRCLKSVEWANDIVVIDMKSTDNTLEIAKKYSARIFEVDDVGYADPARNFGLSKSKNDWVFVIDSDEEAPYGSITLFKDLMNQEKKAWYLARKNILFGKWMKHTNWWPDYQLRFFPKGSVSWSEKVHTLPSSSIPVSYAKSTENNAIIHHNYSSVDDFIDRLNRYTSLELASKKRERVSDPIHAAINEFVNRYFSQEGYLDKTHGLYLSLLQSFYEAVVSIKQWELDGFPEKQSAFNIKELLKTFQYWHADKMYKRSSGLQKFYWRMRRKFKV